MKRRALLVAGVGVLGGCLRNGTGNTQVSGETNQEEDENGTDQENESNSTDDEPGSNATDQSDTLNGTNQDDVSNGTTQEPGSNTTDQENTSNGTDRDDPVNGSDHINDSTGNWSDRDESSECSFRVAIIQEVPDDVTVEDATERLLEFDVIRYAFAHATDPEADHNTVTKQSGEYETFNVFAESDQRFEEVRTALDDFETNRDNDYPVGVYLETDGTVIAIAGQCPT